MLTLFFQYLMSPVAFALTFVLPVAWYVFDRRHVWFSIPLTVLVEIMINWGSFCYYESCGLMILVTFVQAAVMAMVILLLKAAGPLRKK